MSADGTLRFDTSLNTEGLQEGTGRLGSIAKDALGIFAGNMMTKAAEAVASLGREALHAGMSFEASMAKVSTLFTGTDEEFGQLSNTILELSSATGLAADELAEAAYSALSASVPAEDLGTILDKSAKLAAAGFTDVDTALSATAKTMNAYGVTGEEAIDKVQKVLIQTQNLGITTVGELGASLAQVTPTAAAFGVSFEQVGASLAVMTAQGTPTAQATTQLNSLIAELGKSGTTAAKNLAKAAEGSKYAGMSFLEMMDAGATLDEVLGMMQASADESGVSMVDMFSSIEAGKAAMSIFTQEGEVFRNDLRQMGTDADVVGDAYAKVSDTLEFKSQQIKTSLSNIATSLFQMASGPLNTAASAAANALAEIQKGFSENGLAGVGEAVLNMMNGAAEKLESYDWAGAAQGIVDKITGFINGDGSGRFLESAARIIDALVKGIGQALPKLLPAIVQLVTYMITSFISHIPQFLQIGLDIVAGVINGLLHAIPAVCEAILNIGRAILEAFMGFFGIASPSKVMEEQGGYLVEGVLKALAELPGRAAEIFAEVVSKAVEWGRKMLSTAGTAMRSMLSEITGIVQELPGKVWTFLVDTVNKVTSWGQQMLSSASTAMSNMLSKVVSIVQQLPGKIWTHLTNTVSKVTSWGQQMVSNASTAMNNMLSKVMSIVQQLPGKIWTHLSEAAAKVVSWGTELAGKGKDAASKLFDAVVDGLKSLPDEIRDVGRNIVDGLWSGINSGWSWLKDKVGSLAKSLLRSTEKALDINSPSGAFRDEVGRWIPPGIAEGVADAMPRAIRDMEKDAAAMVAKMQAAVSVSAGTFARNAAAPASLRALSAAGTVVHNDNHFEQQNTYNVPVATPSEVSRTQREALRHMVGGVK